MHEIVVVTRCGCEERMLTIEMYVCVTKLDLIEMRLVEGTLFKNYLSACGASGAPSPTQQIPFIYSVVRSQKSHGQWQQDFNSFRGASVMVSDHSILLSLWSLLRGIEPGELTIRFK